MILPTTPPMYQPPPMTIPSGDTSLPTHPTRKPAYIPSLPTNPPTTPAYIHPYIPKKTTTPLKEIGAPPVTLGASDQPFPSTNQIGRSNTIKERIINQVKTIGNKVYTFFKYVIENCLP